MIVPKEQLSAYERWEMSAFADDSHSVGGARMKKKEDAVSADILKVLDELRQEAYTKGMQEGFAVGMAKAREAAQEEKQRFLNLMKSFSDALERADEHIAEGALSLALDVAKAMLKVKLEVDSSAILPVVMEAVRSLPHVQKPAKILVHHEDAKILREYLATQVESQHWYVQEDASIERGGCVIETGANQIDASNEVRWRRLSEALAQKNDWLSP